MRVTGVRNCIRRLPFEAISNALTIITCLAVCGVVLPRYISKPRVEPSHLPSGSAAPPISSLSYTAVQRTVVIAVSSTCEFCGDSAPYFREIADIADSRTDLQVVVAGVEAPDRLAEYVRQNHLGSVAIATVARGSPLVRFTPTVVVVDASATIRGSWLGRLDENKTREVLNTLRY
jgi:hypothetical protein